MSDSLLASRVQVTYGNQWREDFGACPHYLYCRGDSNKYRVGGEIKKRFFTLTPSDYPYIRANNRCPECRADRAVSFRMFKRALASGYAPSATTVLRSVPGPPWRALRCTPCVRHLPLSFLRSEFLVWAGSPVRVRVQDFSFLKKKKKTYPSLVCSCDRVTNRPLTRYADALTRCNWDRTHAREGPTGGSPNRSTGRP